jgi:hypothetical protein
MRTGIRSESFNALSRFYGVLERDGLSWANGDSTDLELCAFALSKGAAFKESPGLVEGGALAGGELAPKLVLC